MTQEERQLLLKDLCARLPYGVMYETPYGPRVLNDIFIYSNGPVYTDHGVGNYNEVFGVELENIKPYLRPMSSMTEDERKYYNQLSLLVADGECDAYEEIDWLNAHHLDFRGLIEKGLALEASEEMYKDIHTGLI